MNRGADWLCAVALLLSMHLRAAETGVPISYTLPADGLLPRSYLVTLAIVEKKNPDWIVSTFVAGARREPAEKLWPLRISANPADTATPGTR